MTRECWLLLLPDAGQGFLRLCRPDGEDEEEEEYELPPVCQEHVLNLATRMIVLVGDMAHKDEYQASNPRCSKAPFLPPYCCRDTPQTTVCDSALTKRHF